MPRKAKPCILYRKSQARQTHVSKSNVLPSTMTFQLSAMPEGTQVHMLVEYRFIPRLGLISRMFEALLMNPLLKVALKQNLTRMYVSYSFSSISWVLLAGSTPINTPVMIPASLIIKLERRSPVTSSVISPRWRV